MKEERRAEKLSHNKINVTEIAVLLNKAYSVDFCDQMI